MKIVILQGAFLPVPAILGGAVEKIWFRMGQEFAALGHEVLHIGRAHSNLPTAETVYGVDYLRILGYETPSTLIRLKWRDLLYSLRAVKQIPRDADIIVTNTFWSPFLLRGLQGRKVYVDVQRVPKGQMRFYQHVGMLRGCSPAIYDAIKLELPTAAHSLVSFVPNPVPFDVKPIEVTREKIILFVGRLHPEKGVHVLIEAFALLQKAISQGWKLVIVGPGETKAGGGGEAYEERLRGLAGKLPIVFTGSVYNESELTTYYAQASIFCYPAQEGSGDAAPVAPREAMAYGCVPVVSSLPCFSDIITNQENGVIYNQNAPEQAAALAQAIDSLIDDEASLHKMAEQGKQIAHKYSARLVAQEFIKDFEEIYRAR